MATTKVTQFSADRSRAHGQRSALKSAEPTDLARRGPLWIERPRYQAAISKAVTHNRIINQALAEIGKAMGMMRVSKQRKVQGLGSVLRNAAARGDIKKSRVRRP